MKPNKPAPAKTGSKASILLVDDHPLVRSGLREMIERAPDLTCSGEADSVAGAFEAAERILPDLVLLDLRLGNGDGLELIKMFKARFPDLKVVVLSQLDEMVYGERALRAGALGYVMKEHATQEVLAAMRTVVAGGIHVSRRLSELAVRRLAGIKPTGGERSGLTVDELTDREIQVLLLLGNGYSTKKIAEDMGLNFKTVETHRENIKRKLSLPDAASLVHYANLWVRHKGDQSLPT